MESFSAGRRASGNSWASTTTPTRMSTRSKSSQEMVTRGAGSAGGGGARQRGQRGPGIVVEDDLPRVIAEIGHRLGAPLIEPDPVAVAPAHEARGVPRDRHREQRA